MRRRLLLIALACSIPGPLVGPGAAIPAHAGGASHSPPRSTPSVFSASQAGRHRALQSGVTRTPERIRLESRAAIRGLRRDLAREVRASTIRRVPSPRAAERARSDWRLEERLDEVESLSELSEVERRAEPAASEHRRPADLSALERWSGRPLGPTTRAILERSRIHLRGQLRRQVADDRADALRPAEAAEPQLPLRRGARPELAAEPHQAR